MTDIIYWNTQGMKNIFAMCKSDKHILIKNDIICITETFSTGNFCFSQTPGFANFRTITSPAIKNKQKGRASGGIALGYNVSNFELVKIIDNSNLWIFCKLRHKLTNTNIIIGVSYINQATDIEVALELLELVFLDINCNYPNEKVILGGDFNARVGNLGYVDPELVNPDIHEFRKSIDAKVNKRGKLLINSLENHGFVLLNGRCNQDYPGNFTYNSNVGLSTIDLIWVNRNMLNYTNSFKVLTDFAVSDHDPCKLTLSLINKNYFVEGNGTISTRINWEPGKNQMYTTKMEQLIVKMEQQPTEINGMYTHIKNMILDTAYQCDMVKSSVVSKQVNVKDKPWWDTECNEGKKQVRASRKQCKLNDYDPENIKLAKIAKNNFKLLCKNKRREHELKIQYLLANTHRSADFWNCVNSFRHKPAALNVISKKEWEFFYKSKLPAPEVRILFFQPEVMQLDCLITLDELIYAGSKLKNKKAPGTDAIRNEFLKHTPLSGKEIILNFFNQVLETEQTPVQWSEIEIVALYKKGEKNDPSNYRGISLLNTSLKWFTQIMLTRLSKWTEDLGIIPESQAGFRKSRGCQDHIFSLSSIIHTHIQKPGGRVFAAFVDFERAFDSVNHNLLWETLHSLGVSSKFINIFSSLYSKAIIKVRTLEGHSDPITLTEGVLQGELCSPIFFNLFIHDIEKYFNDLKISEIEMGHGKVINLLLYADDKVLLATSSRGLQLKLNALNKYCINKRLKVNVKKTKIVVFRKGGKLSKDLAFKYNGEHLEIVNQFTYLGTTFSSSGLFKKESEAAIRRVSSQTGAVWDIFTKSKIESWEGRMKLFDSICQSSLLYACESWAPYYERTVESVQMKFLKHLLNLPRNTPNYIVRSECNRPPIMMTIFKYVLRFLVKVLRMSEDRIPKICYNKLRDIDSQNINIDPKYNWCKKIRIMMEGVGCMDVWDSQDPDIILSNISSICEKLRIKYFEEDRVCIINSSCCPLYRGIIISGIDTGVINKQISLDKLRVISRVRCWNKYTSMFKIHGINYSINPGSNCTVCKNEENSPEDLFHLMIKCELYTSYRRFYLANYISDITHPDLLYKLFELNNSNDKLHNVYKYIRAMFCLRSWCLNE